MGGDGWKGIGVQNRARKRFHLYAVAVSIEREDVEWYTPPKYLFIHCIILAQ